MFDKLKDILFFFVMIKFNGWFSSLFLMDVEKFVVFFMLYRINCKFLIGSVKEIFDEFGFSILKDDLFYKFVVKRWEDVNKIFVLE